MAIKRYAKGRRKEYAIVHRLKQEGFDIAQRTAGSHSPFDVIAVHKEKKIIFLVQSKPEGWRGKKYDEYDWLNDEFQVRFILE